MLPYLFADVPYSRTIPAISAICASDNGRASASLYSLFIRAYLSAADVSYGNGSIPSSRGSDAANAAVRRIRRQSQGHVSQSRLRVVGDVL